MWVTTWEVEAPVQSVAVSLIVYTFGSQAPGSEGAAPDKTTAVSRVVGL